VNTLAALQLNRSIQYNDKSHSNTTQQSITEIANACKILYIFIQLTSSLETRKVALSKLTYESFMFVLYFGKFLVR